MIRHQHNFTVFINKDSKKNFLLNKWQDQKNLNVDPDPKRNEVVGNQDVSLENLKNPVSLEDGHENRKSLKNLDVSQIEAEKAEKVKRARRVKENPGVSRKRVSKRNPVNVERNLNLER